MLFTDITPVKLNKKLGHIFINEAFKSQAGVLTLKRITRLVSMTRQY